MIERFFYDILGWQRGDLYYLTNLLPVLLIVYDYVANLKQLKPHRRQLTLPIHLLIFASFTVFMGTHPFHWYTGFYVLCFTGFYMEYQHHTELDRLSRTILPFLTMLYVSDAWEKPALLYQINVLPLPLDVKLYLSAVQLAVFTLPATVSLLRLTPEIYSVKTVIAAETVLFTLSFLIMQLNGGYHPDHTAPLQRLIYIVAYWLLLHRKVTFIT